ncbi:MAG TPA: lipid-A-disaccharide synthase [Candidatus Synoicihabitans sp.]|nr:lipid-A-disaccharide synthase [Candidatus Synoicihabitans sp.]
MRVPRVGAESDRRPRLRARGGRVIMPALPFRLPPPAAGRVDVLIVAGEHSGDQHAAAMVRALRSREPQVQVCALGGPELQRAGAQLLYDLTASSVVGLIEVLKNYSFFKALFAAALEWIETHRPKVVCFIDYPGFNLRLARALHERRLAVKAGGFAKLLFYISPQIWAWKSGRRFAMAQHLDALAVIFPFEVGCYRDTSLPVTFVGHPFLENGHESPVFYDPDGPILLLPGSREQAVRRIFPVILAGYTAVATDRPAVVLYPSAEIRHVLESVPRPRSVRLERGGSRALGASAVLTSSGTMSMHCALAGIPGAIAYRANPLTYFIGRRLVKVPYLGIANLLLNEPMYPEYLQNAATPTALARELRSSLEEPARRERTAQQATRLREILSAPAAMNPAAWLQQYLAAN